MLLKTKIRALIVRSKTFSMFRSVDVSVKPIVLYGCCRTFLTQAPRVRFAPSPTGYLHLGGLRTALYNFVYAKSRGGTFILRIEDTDQSRKVDGSLEGLIRDLHWAGIEYQEGPGKSGDFGPYVQSERLDLYKKHVEQLISNRSAYYCFCTERRLDLLRRDAVRRQEKPKYDNKCRSLSEKEVNDNMTAGKPYCIRFKLTSDCQVFEDLVFGSIAYDVSLNEGDPVIVKSDGFPTYHFANVVDDHLMAVTHVLRGVEWQISTTKHLLLYKAFNWNPPLFGHLPLIVNADGTKLSKRQSDVKVEDYRNKGIYPLALLNYLTMAGGGFPHEAGAGVRLRTANEMAQEISNVSPHPSRLNPDLLSECNRLDIKRQLEDKDLSTVLVQDLQRFVTNKFPSENLNLSDDYVRNILRWAAKRIDRLEELTGPEFAFLWVLPSNIDDIDVDIINVLIKELERFDCFDESSVKRFLREFSSCNRVEFPEFMKMLRSILSGLTEGPGVSEMMEILGKEQSLVRLKAVLR